MCCRSFPVVDGEQHDDGVFAPARGCDDGDVDNEECVPQAGEPAGGRGGYGRHDEELEKDVRRDLRGYVDYMYLNARRGWG